MTYPYTTLKNEDQNNSPWVPRALSAVGLGALAFASGTIYRNSNNNNDVVASTTTLVRGGGGGEDQVFHLADDGLTKKENDVVPLAVCSDLKTPNLAPVCTCAKKKWNKEEGCQEEFENCTNDKKRGGCKGKVKECFEEQSIDGFRECMEQYETLGKPIVYLQLCLATRCSDVYN